MPRCLLELFPDERIGGVSSPLVGFRSAALIFGF